MAWYPYEGGTSVGQSGSEGGVIVVDEEHPDGARITLERDGAVAPWSITCGVYGWMAHTRFFPERAQAEIALGPMKSSLELVMTSDDEDRFTDFVNRFP
jgi:hypothetical protein